MDTLDEPSQNAWRRTFLWLAAIELEGHDAEPALPAESRLRERTRALAVLFDLLPRDEVERLPDVISAWVSRFGDQPKVPLAQLRRVARETLAVRKPNDEAEDLWQRAVQLSRWRVEQPTSRPLPGPSATVSEEERKCLAEGLLAWFRELSQNPHRRTLPGVVPGEAARPMSEVYVELSAVEDSEVTQSDDDGESSGSDRNRVRRLPLDAPAISVEAMISRTVERCLVVGDPGSGKSTLVQWLVWAAFERKLSDFDLAIEIKLSAYAAALVTASQVTPLEFFFQSLGHSVADAQKAAAGLRQTAIESHRCLLLFDGWDEVPTAQRATVKDNLVNVDPAFITVVTSRPSGMPRQFLDRQRVSSYRITGLTPSLAQELTTKVLGQLRQPERSDAIWSRIQNDPDLLEMAANPFLLGLLVRALVRTGVDLRGTRAEVYRHLTAWMREQYEQRRGTQPTLTARHIERLAELSFRLLSDPETPRYLFTRRELEASLQGLEAEPVLQSRFVTRPIAMFDEFAVLHATIQEFLAAEHVAGRPVQEQQEFLDRSFFSASRLIVLEFFAGLGGSSSRLCRDAARQWWNSRDRFLHVVLRLARLAAAGRWPVDDLNRRIRDALWGVIADETEIELCQAAAQAYAELDPVELVQRAQRSPPSNWAINCILNVIPENVAREQRLDQLLNVEWQEFEGLQLRGGGDGTDAELSELRQRLAQWDASVADLREAVAQIGASRSESDLPALIRIANGESLHASVREESIASICRIGGRPAVTAMLDLLLSGSAISDVMARMAAIGFVLPSSPRLRLDPRGRDRLLRRLAAVAPESPRIENYLTALEGFPIREGAAVIAELASTQEVSLGVRRKAITVLASVADRQLLSDLLARIKSEPAELIGDWLYLALQRSLTVPLPWLEDQVRHSRNRVQRHKYLKVLFRVLSQSDVETRLKHASFLDRLVAAAVRRDSQDDELALGLVGAINDVLPRRCILFSRKILKLALQLLAWTAEGRTDSPPDQVRLAVAIVHHFRETDATSVLKRLLERLRLQGDASADDKPAVAVAECLAELCPSELLRFPTDCPVVTSVLRTRSISRGWIVYTDRILNAEGMEIATVSQGEEPIADVGQPVELQTILQQLSPQARRVLESYWLMVREGGPCHPGDSYLSIHNVAVAHYDAAEESELGNLLQGRFPTGFPKLDAWTKQLNRVETKYSQQPNVKAMLSSLGLFRR